MADKAIDKVIDVINSGRRFLITAHMNVEGDALGSELAVYLLLKKLKKKVVILNNDVTPEMYKFLPSSVEIKNKVTADGFDAAIVLDCSDISRVGGVINSLSGIDCIVNIDHHISNAFFGTVNWVEKESSSTAQMIYELCERFGIMDKNIAVCLYTGISTDTGNFSYECTKSTSHRIAAELLDYNIYPNKIYESLHSSCSPLDLSFIGKVVSSLKFDANQKICWAVIPKWVYGNYDPSEIIFSIMRLLKGFEVFILLKRIDSKRTRVNFRSRSLVDVNKIARFFGGGGHKRASGTTVGEPLGIVEKKVISYVKKYTDKIKVRKRKQKFCNERIYNPKKA